MELLSYFLFFTLLGSCLCYCPPLIAPQTTELTCVEPIKLQHLNCSASWLPKGTLAYFKCLKGSKRAKGRIVCSEDGVHRHIQKPGLRNLPVDYLPCGIKKDVEKAEIHVYSFQAPVRYNLTDKDNPDYQLHGEALHNKFREKHGSPPLRLQTNLSRLAQEWAEKVSISGKLDMAPNLSFGQNIFLSQTSDLTGAVNDAVQNWYYSGLAEYCWEDVIENWSSSLALEFSQVIWKDSKYIGIGASPLKSRNGTAVIAFYDPTGNIVIDGDEEESEKSFELNVLPLQANFTL